MSAKPRFESSSAPFCCVTSSRLLKLSVPQFTPPRKTGSDCRTYLRGFLWGLSEIVSIKGLVKELCVQVVQGPKGTGEKLRPVWRPYLGLTGPPRPHSWPQSQAGSTLHHIKAPTVPVCGRACGPLVQRQIRARSYQCGRSTQHGGGVPCSSSPCPFHSPQSTGQSCLGFAVWGFGSAGS